MHFFYGLGAFVSPMIASPFLLNIDCTPFIDGYTLSAGAAENVSIAPQPKVVDRAFRLSHSKEAFFILGTIQVLITNVHVISLLLAILYSNKFVKFYIRKVSKGLLYNV